MAALSSLAIRQQIEAALADRIPSALTPAPLIIRQVVATGIRSVDELLDGGLPLGAITEMVGPECSGGAALTLSFIAGMTQAAKVCAWIDVSDTFHPESAAAVGVDLTRILWIRCGVSPITCGQPSSQNSFTFTEKYLVPAPVKKGLHGGGFGPHPRGEMKGLSNAVGDFLKPEMTIPRCAEPQPKVRTERAKFESISFQPSKRTIRTISRKPWSRIEQALRVTDLLLQAGGFSAIVLDMGSIAPEHVSRVPLATWFRYRTAAKRTQASILLLTQHACSKSSAELVLRMRASNATQQEATIFTGIEHQIEVSRQRFSQASANVIPLRKPPQRENTTSWQSRTSWRGRR